MRSFTLPYRQALLAPALILAGAFPASGHPWELLENRIVSQSKQDWSLVLKDAGGHSGLALGALTASMASDFVPTDLEGHAFAIAANQTAQLFLKREPHDAGGSLACTLKAADGTEAGFLLTVHGWSSEFESGPSTGGSSKVSVQPAQITLDDGDAGTPAQPKAEAKGGD